MSGNPIAYSSQPKLMAVAFGASARGTTDAVHVVGGILRQIEIEDVADVGNVQSARSHVGRDQHCQLAVVELPQEAQSLGLWHIAGQRLGVKAVRVQHLLEPLGHPARIDEYQRAMRLGVAQQSDQQWNLFFHRREIDDLSDAVDRDFVGLDTHQLRVIHMLVGELEYAVRERG